MAGECIKTLESETGEMSVNMCTMLRSCNCGGKDCCSKSEEK